MRVKDWTFVEEAGDFKKLPVGGYVVQITGISDNEREEYLEVTYDIAEGDYRGMYQGQESKYHNFRRYYGEKAARFFKGFLNRLEESNPSFSVAGWQTTCNPQLLCGLYVGVVFQDKLYTNEKGEDKKIIEAVAWKNVNDIRSGNFEIPEPRDMRKKIEQPEYVAQEPDDKIPF